MLQHPVWGTWPRPVQVAQRHRSAYACQALQRCHQASLSPPTEIVSKVKLRGKTACRISGGTMQFVPITCSIQHSGYFVLFEPLDQGLPAGLLTSPALLKVEGGTVYVPITNVGTTDLLVPSCQATVFSQAATPSVQEQIDSICPLYPQRNIIKLGFSFQGLHRSFLLTTVTWVAPT